MIFCDICGKKNKHIYVNERSYSVNRSVDEPYAALLGSCETCDNPINCCGKCSLQLYSQTPSQTVDFVYKLHVEKYHLSIDIV